MEFMNQGKIYSQREKSVDDKQVVNLTGLVNIFFLLKFASSWISHMQRKHQLMYLKTTTTTNEGSCQETWQRDSKGRNIHQLAQIIETLNICFGKLSLERMSYETGLITEFQTSEACKCHSHSHLWIAMNWEWKYHFMWSWVIMPPQNENAQS